MAIPFTGKRPPRQVAKAEPKELPVRDVFVVGGTPTYTYVDRSASGMRDRFFDAIEDRGKIITISGPTKSGKTVFCKQMLADAERVWVHGGSIPDANALWTTIVHKLGGATARQIAIERASEETKTAGGELGINALGLSGHAGKQSGRTRSASSSVSQTRVSSLVDEATELLLRSDAILIVDDFHYIDEAERIRIVRALRGPLGEGLRIVFLCVPHRAIEPIRAEREMQGRIALIEVPDWVGDELREIASKGFSALNVEADDGVLDEFVAECFGSPHLMQEFCKHLCRTNGVKGRQLLRKTLAVRDRNGFFRRIVDDGAQDVLEALAAGPLTSRTRLQRTFVGGESGDIYVATLRAIANTGPKAKLTYNELRESLRGILEGEPPAAHEITRVLEKISQISRRRFGDRGAIDFEETRKTIHIVDPFVAFYMRWGKPIGGDL